MKEWHKTTSVEHSLKIKTKFTSSMCPLNNTFLKVSKILSKLHLVQQKATFEKEEARKNVLHHLPSEWVSFLEQYKIQNFFFFLIWS